LIMSDQAADPTSGEQGSLNSGISPTSETSSEPGTASAAADTTGATVSVVKSSNADAAKADASAEAAQPKTIKPETSTIPAKVIVMPRGDHTWSDNDIDDEPATEEQQQSVFGKRRIAAIAAVLALATVSGAVGGALATASLMNGSSDVAARSSQHQASLETSLSRIDTDIQSLKTGLEHTSKIGMSQFNKTTDRLDKLERAQAEPTAKLAKLSEAIDKLKVAPAAAPAVAAAAPKETTGSISSAPVQQQVASAAPTAPKSEAKSEKAEVGRLPTLDEWAVRDIGYGGAVVGNRRGNEYEVYAGDSIPGLGRVDAIRRQDGHWVVVTSRGLIVAR
jgi:hypothetical protein